MSVTACIGAVPRTATRCCAPHSAWYGALALWYCTVVLYRGTEPRTVPVSIPHTVPGTVPRIVPGTAPSILPGTAPPRIELGRVPCTVPSTAPWYLGLHSAGHLFLLF